MALQQLVLLSIVVAVSQALQCYQQNEHAVETFRYLQTTKDIQDLAVKSLDPIYEAQECTAPLSSCISLNMTVNGRTLSTKGCATFCKEQTEDFNQLKGRLGKEVTFGYGCCETNLCNTANGKFPLSNMVLMVGTVVAAMWNLIM